MNTSSNVIVTVSGGKDSTLCLALALKHYKNVIPIFNDTGWEHPLTYQYLSTLEKHFNITIIHTKGVPNKTLEETILERRDFPNGIARFCTSQLKRKALAQYYQDNLYPAKYEIWFGIRTQESVSRQKKYQDIISTEYYEPHLIFPAVWTDKSNAKILLRFPILDLTEIKVYKWLNKLKVPINPLYQEGTNDRVGCYPCLLSSRKKQEAMFATPFGKIQLQKIKKLENMIGQKYAITDTDNQCAFCQD